MEKKTYGPNKIIKKEDFGGNDRARELVDDPKEYIGLHSTTLFDENEDQSGAVIDEATGKRINNEQDMPTSQAFNEEPEEEKIDKLRKELSKDDATEYLRSMGFDEFGNEIPKSKE